MVDKIVAIVGTVFAVTALGIALNPHAQTAKVISSLTGGIATMQKAAYGNM